MFRSRSWFGGGLWKPKNVHSLEHLKYLYNVLSKNQIVSEHNRGLLVETLRSIAEILIWGDQNDSSVFDFFLEKNMLSFFLKIMKQKCGSYVCVQLLQTLNILFENIRNETSLYYLLSNNHVNSIIVHKFDFSDEEVMAYYISFLKTLSLKLNAHTIHFFYNEHTNDFPLYTEAIKFFKHPESMVRIAVRTLTLNVYRVDDASMLQFIRDKTAAPYFSNLVWFIGNHILELDNCVRNDADHQSQNRLADLVAEHLDHLHYLNDILSLQIDDLNQVLSDHLLNKLLIPLYIYSLIQRKYLEEKQEEFSAIKPHVSIVVSLFLLSQVFLIITHRPLVHTLAAILLDGNFHVFSQGACEKLADQMMELSLKPGFVAPTETLEKSLETNASQDSQTESTNCDIENSESASGVVDSFSNELTKGNFTDEEKEQRRSFEPSIESFCDKPFFEAIISTLQCNENDYSALFSLCLLYALGHNKGIDKNLLDTVLYPSEKSDPRNKYNIPLVERLIKIINSSCQSNCRIRLVTLELATRLLAQLVIKNGTSVLHDGHLAAVEGAREESTSLLRNFYKSEDFFLDMFEDEYNEMKKRPLNVEWLTMDANILLPPTGTPMTGIEFSKRLPCGEVERARRAIRVFFLIRELSFSLGCNSSSDSNNGSHSASLLPLTNPQSCVQVDHALDLNNSDLIACTVVTKDGHKLRRFLVIDAVQLILVEPETRRLGWGIAKFVGFLQDIEVIGDKDDSRCLHITVHRPLSSSSTNRVPLLSAKFIFDDHIRCMAAKQRLTKGRLKARQKKMHLIARLLDLPTSVQPCPSPPVFNLLAQRHEASRLSRQTHRPLLVENAKVPGYATALRRENLQVSTGAITRGQSPGKRRSESSHDRSMHRITSGGGRVVSRDSSPRNPRPRSEEIPLEDMAKTKPWPPPNGGESSSRSNHHILESSSPRRRHSSHSSPHRLSLAPNNGQLSFPSTSSQSQDSQTSKNNTNQDLLHSNQRVPEETSFTQPQEISALPPGISNGERKTSQTQQKRRGIIETV